MQQREPKVPPVEIPAAELARIKALYLQGRYRAAHEAGAAFGPLRGWSGPAGRLLAGRLAMQLGAPRLGRRLHAVAFRESPAYPEAVYYQARFRMERFGTYACWRFTRQHTDWDEASPEIRADWAALQAFLAARLRDFDRADKFLIQSEATCPNRPWHYVERSSVLEFQDKLDEGIASARRSLELQPWFRPGVQAVAHLLLRKGCEGEAIDLLTEAVGRLESGMIAAQLAAMQLDLHRYTDAAVSIERFAELSPLMEPEVAEWMAARRADVAYLLGDYPAAAEQADGVGKDDEFYAAFAGKLRGGVPAAPPRDVLPLDLSYDSTPAQPHDLLGTFWGVPVPPATAEAGVATDGLPDVGERRRFEAAGWSCREFTLTFDTAVALLRRRVPFLATLFEGGYGQPRLILGFDTVRESVFLAEPVERKPVEAPMSMVRERFAVTGPRCLVVVPPGKENLLTEVPLPDADLYDRLHTIQGHLSDLKHGEAKRELDGLTAERPGHHVTQAAAVAWARATGHPVLMLDAVNAILAAHPHDATFGMAKANVLRELGRIHERTTFLKTEGGRADADPLLVQSYAQVLLNNPHGQDEAARLLRRSIRQRPHAPAGYFLLSAHRWEHQQFDESVELHRMACCLDEREDQFAEAYVRVARATEKFPDAIRLLQRRATRGERPTPAAVRALFHGLVERGEPEFAWKALDKGIERLTADDRTRNDNEGTGNPLSELRLFRAEMLAGHGRFTEAEAELTAVRADSPPVVWHKAAARIARLKPDFVTALGHLKSLLELEPLNAEGQRLCVGLVAETEGKPAARAYLADLCTRFPFSYPMLRLRAEFLTGEPGDGAVRAARDLLDLCPHDAWAHRQLALVYGDARRIDEATVAAQKAGEYEPDHPSQFAVLANVLRRADRTEEALATFRAGLSKYVDHELAVAELVRTARGRKEKKAALQFVREQLDAQATNGEGLLAYREQAVQLVEDPEEQEQLFADLERFLDDRPDLWQAWSLVIQQMAMAHRTEEAYSLAKEATARFPLLSRLWMDLAETCRLTNRPEERIDALRRAIGCAPGWSQAAKELADALAEQDDFDEAVMVLEANLPRAGLDPLAHWFLAERLWNSDRGEEALRHAEAAVRHEPGYDWMWAAVANWGERLDRPDAALNLARDLAVNRGGDARVWMKLARSLYRYEQTDEALAALDRAIALEPDNPEPHDLKAERLADVGRFDEALAAANPPHLLEDLPLILQGRAAWVEARRGNHARAIPMMQALVSVDPQYYWGWSQLADWYNETDKAEAFLEATEEMMKLRPDHPTPLTMRGEAKLQTDDRDGGKADLREALKLHPGYSPAAAILFDACLADGEWKEARAALSVLQEHMTGTEVLVKQLVYAARTEDEDGITRAFADICMADGEGPPSPTQAALTEMREAGYEEKAADLMAEAWRSGERFNPWAALFWLTSPAGEEASLDDQIAACDAVIREYPKFLTAYDHKAEHLARGGRFDDARQACESSGITPTPITLRGRAAWVEAVRGDKNNAIEMMRACLAEDPDYAWGWRQLAHWHDELGRPRECLEAAEHLVRLAPNDPYAFGIRGEAKRILGDHRGAREDFRKAFDLDPQFDAAGHQLLSEQLATDDLDGASDTLAAMEEHSDGPLLQLRAVQLAARKKDLTRARSALRALATHPKVFQEVLSDAAKALDDENWSAEADEELAAALEHEDCTPATAAVWVMRQVAAGHGWKVSDRLKELADRVPDAGREAALVYAAAMAATGQPETATAVTQRFADLIRKDDDAWGRAGATLADTGKYPLAMAWLSDWKERAGCEPWMLRALADGYRLQGDDARAHEVLVAAEQLADDTGEDLPPDLRAWLALDEMLAGRPDSARTHLGKIDPPGQVDAVKLLMALATAPLTVRNAKDKSKAFVEAKEDLRAAADACPRADLPPGVGRVYQVVVTELVTATGGLAAKLWGWWQRIRPFITT